MLTIVILIISIDKLITININQLIIITVINHFQIILVKALTLIAVWLNVVSLY